jgi:hypothetical protein
MSLKSFQVFPERCTASLVRWFRTPRRSVNIREHADLLRHDRDSFKFRIESLVAGWFEDVSLQNAALLNTLPFCLWAYGYVKIEFP